MCLFLAGLILLCLHSAAVTDGWEWRCVLLHHHHRATVRCRGRDADCRGYQIAPDPVHRLGVDKDHYWWTEAGCFEMKHQRDLAGDAAAGRLIPDVDDAAAVQSCVEQSGFCLHGLSGENRFSLHCCSDSIPVKIKILPIKWRHGIFAHPITTSNNY